MDEELEEWEQGDAYIGGLFPTLDIPPIWIPGIFAPELQIISQLVYATRKPKASIYDLEHYSLEAIQKPVNDYLMLGFAGHGTHSWAFHYYLSYKALHIFAQLQWGTKNTDLDLVASRFEGLFSGVELLFEAQEAGDFIKNQRLIVIESDFCGSSHGWVQGYPSSFEETTFEPSPNHMSFVNALHSLQGQLLAH